MTDPLGGLLITRVLLFFLFGIREGNTPALLWSGFCRSLRSQMKVPGCGLLPPSWTGMGSEYEQLSHLIQSYKGHILLGYMGQFFAGQFHLWRYTGCL